MNQVSTLSPQELQQAFQVFSLASSDLCLAYEELRQEGERLTQELALANGELRRQFEAREAERESRQRQERLAAMGEMAARLAHQLRTPLATALLYAAQLGGEDLPAAERERYCKRHLADPLVVFIDKTFLIWVALGLLIPYLIAGWQGLLWGGFVRIAVVNHVTWAVNSVCHTFGDRPFNIKDESRNNWIVGLLAFGEGWHHNHHAFPAMAYHGMSWRQFDLTALIIRLLAKLKLVSNIKLPSSDLVERRRRKPEVASGTGAD